MPMKRKTKFGIIIGTLSILATTGILLYKLGDIKREIKYRQILRDDEF